MVPPSSGRRPNRIAALRDTHSLSQAKLAARLVPPTTDATINKLEKGKMGLTLEWLYKIARALSVHPSELLADPPYTAEERAMLEAYRELGESERRLVSRLLDALSEAEDDSG